MNIFFFYSRKAQELFRVIEYADLIGAGEFGMQMTLYCGLLEHLAEDREKDEDVLQIIDVLLCVVNGSGLSSEKKLSLSNFLMTGKKVSARQKCNDFIRRYAPGNYYGYTSKKIFEDAYSCRSAYSHGSEVELRMPAYYFKYVLLDIIKGYMQEKQK